MFTISWGGSPSYECFPLILWLRATLIHGHQNYIISFCPITKDICRQRCISHRIQHDRETILSLIEEVIRSDCGTVCSSSSSWMHHPWTFSVPDCSRHLYSFACFPWTWILMSIFASLVTFRLQHMRTWPPWQSWLTLTSPSCVSCDACLWSGICPFSSPFSFLSTCNWRWKLALTPPSYCKGIVEAEKNNLTDLDLSLLSLDLSLDLDLCLDLRSLDLDLRSFDLDFLSLDLDLRSRDLDLLSLERDFLCFDLDLRSRDRDLLSLGLDSRSFDFGSLWSLKWKHYCQTMRKLWTNLSLVLESLSLEALPADRPPGEPWSGFCNSKASKNMLLKLICFLLQLHLSKALLVVPFLLLTLASLQVFADLLLQSNVVHPLLALTNV